jgi:hypothetical protein
MLQFPRSIVSDIDKICRERLEKSMEEAGDKIVF